MATLSIRPGRTLVCEEGDVERLTLHGYKLREVIYGDYLFHSQEQTRVPDDYGNDKVASRLDRTLVLRQPRFIMVEDECDTIAGQTAALEEAVAVRDEACTQAAEATRRAEEAEKRAATLAAQVERSAAERRAENAIAAQLRGSAHSLEVDLGKVRAAIGDLRMKEILGR